MGDSENVVMTEREKERDLERENESVKDRQTEVKTDGETERQCGITVLLL